MQDDSHDLRASNIVQLDTLSLSRDDTVSCRLSTPTFKYACQVSTHKICQKNPDQHFAKPESLQECYHL